LFAYPGEEDRRMDNSEHYTVVVIGTGFGGTMTALSLAHKLKEDKRESDEAKNIFMLE
jgi:hypothetical protein